MSDSQEVGVVLAFDLPVNLAKIGTGYLQDNPIAGFLISLLAFFVLMAVLAVPISALFGIEIFPGLLPHARSLGGDLNLSTMLNNLMGSQVVTDFLEEPLEDFVDRILGNRQARAIDTVGTFVGRAASAMAPLVSVLDYDNAFVAVQVPGDECRQRLMCHVHTQVSRLPPLLQEAYGWVGPHMQHQQRYSSAILTGLSGGDCQRAFPDCPYNVIQMASFVPFLKNKNVKNEL
ncbi:uncharacterized protein [Penaeus vannamei]|uniref:uncharacterized protein n=1 Tax=Penaeus vannamei TaxID=6689 RepID=UPI000F68497A|nr:uncharacterized protein LOC113829092 [Penaeus vannamei]